MANTFFQILQKPLNDQTELAWYRRINWRWFLQRAPILLLGIDSSYNVAKYTGLDGTPTIIQIVNGVTFDFIFVGLIALADQFRSVKRSSDILFWVINVGAMLFAAVLGTLAYSHGLYVNISAESITRGVSPPFLGLLYNLFYHSITGEILATQRKEIEAKPYACGACAARFERQKQLNGHRAQCAALKEQNASKE